MKWKTFFRVFLFVFAFTVNVTVKAEVLQEPKGCHKKADGVCAYFARGDHEVLNWGSDTVRLSKGTSFVRVSEEDYRLVSGTGRDGRRNGSENSVWKHKG